MAKKLIVGNWKLNPQSLEEGKRIIRGISRKIPKNTTVVVCPPSVFLGAFTGKKSALSFGVQDVYFEQSGAFTGEYSAKMAQSAGATYAIVGHSERRAMGETSAIVSKKAVSSLKAGLITILCVGEKERDHHGHYLSYLKAQIDESLVGVTNAMLNNLVVAYEPIWAIGSSSQGAIEATELHEMSLFIKKVLHTQFGKKALNVPLLYGGSVDLINTVSLIKDGNVSGLLIGRESLKPEHFLKILSEVSTL